MRDKPHLTFGKIPPQAVEIERAVLGAVMLERNILHQILPLLPKKDVFYTDPHQKIWAAILALEIAGNAIDLLTVCQELRNNGEIDHVGGMAYVMELTKDVVTGAHAEDHARIIVEKYVLRECIRVCSAVINEAYDDADPFDLLSVAERELHEAGQIINNSSTLHISQIGKTCIEDTDAIRNDEVPQGGLPSGIRSIDAVTGGWQKTDLIVIAARPAVGKTALMLNMMYNSGVPALIFSLEMGNKQLYKRMAANSAEIPLDWLTHPKRMSESYNQKWLAEYTKLSKTKIFINDKAGISTTEMRAIATEHIRKYGIGIIGVDYLQLATAKTKNNANREQEIAQISRDLKKMAKDFDIPVIALSQLSRSLETRANNKPMLADLRESGAIEQDADVICFLYGSGDESLKGFKNFDIAKHRNGVTDDMLLKFQGEYQRFSDSEPEPFTGTPAPYETQGDNPRAGFRNYKPYTED